MINATNPAVANTNLPPPLLDQEETSTATGANTNAAASAQSQSTNTPSNQGISALEYDANFSTTRDPSSVDSNQMLMINPNSVNPNATRANVQGQMETPNRLMLGSSADRLTTANTANESAQARTSDASGSTMIAGIAKKSPVINIQGVGANSQGISQPDKNGKQINYGNDDYTFADKKLGGLKVSGVEGTLGSQGCTITALTNVLGYSAKEAGMKAPTVRDTNSKNETFFNVFDKTSFRDLTGKGEQLRRDRYFDNSVSGLGDPKGNMTPIATLSQNKDKTLKAAMLSEPTVLKEVRKSLEDGKPVLLGLSKNAEKSTRVTAPGDNWSRHTVVANGIDAKGNITVVDSADGKTKTLKEVVERWGDNNIDRAYEVTSRAEKKLTPAQEGLRHKQEEILNRNSR
jgi:hypothetical protein